MSTVFTERLRRAIFMKGIKQSDLVEKTGLDKGSISSYVAGRYKPNASALVKLAAALGVDAAWLSGEAPDIDPVKLIKKDYDFQAVPVVGRVAAGAPIFALENQIDTVMVREQRTGIFGLRVVGDSMAPRIMDGDLVLVHQQDDAKDGDIVIALVDDEATCKVIKKSAWGVSLVPFNSSYAPFVYTEREAEERMHIVGKVIGSYHSWE